MKTPTDWGDYPDLSTCPRDQLEQQYNFAMSVLGCMVRHFGARSNEVLLPVDSIGQEGALERLHYRFNKDGSIEVKLEEYGAAND